MQCKALAATTDPGMLELLRAILLQNNGNFKDIPFTLKKMITLGDIITLDRAVQRDTRSVVYFVTQIDPAEGETDTEKLRKIILNLEEDMRSNEIKLSSDECL